MEFFIKNNDEITLPGWIGGSSLTLQEIGAIVCLACLETDGDSEALGARFSSEEFSLCAKPLIERGIVKVSFNKEKSRMKMDIDLDEI